MLKKLTKINIIGRMSKNMIEVNLCPVVNSWIFEIKVVPGIKKVFIRRVEIT